MPALRYWSHTMRARARMEQDYFASLKKHGWNKPYGERMLNLTELNEMLGTQEILQDGERYDGKNFGDNND